MIRVHVLRIRARRLLPRIVSRDRAQFLIRLLERHARPQSGVDFEVAHAVLDLLRRRIRQLERFSDDTVHLRERTSQRWQHADHLVGSAAETDRRADHIIASTKTSLPNFVTQHDRVRPARDAFFAREIPAPPA